MARTAPNFSLLDQYGQPHGLKDYRGQWLVVYFYPSDSSINCKIEACSFRDEQQIIAQFGNAAIIGINKSSVKSHAQFAKVNKLTFPILSDPDHKITEAFGAWRTPGVKWHDRPWATRRNTYVINPKGKIVKEYIGVNPRQHVEQLISDLQQLQAMPQPAA
jgi:peroxiredoxin Q/BCP